jgi:putative phage-type endonuclease
MEIFHLPLNTTHLRHQLKWLSYLRKMSFRQYASEVYQILDDPAMAKMWRRRRIVSRLLEKYGVNDQRSQTWHLKRGEMITASEVTKTFKTATPSARREIMLRKIEGPKPGEGGSMGAACAWGTQFEPVAKDLYCRMNGGGTIVDTSCVVHPTYPFLGASPDGIYMPIDQKDPRWGKLIEFKCPISRKFDEKTPIPDAYYHQMQMQMECTDIDECDYVEMRFATFTKTEWEKQDVPFKGRFAVFDNGFVDYDTEDCKYWKNRLSEQGDEYRVVYWILANWRCSTVSRDFNWLPSHLEEFTSFWSEVQNHKLNGTVPVKEEKVITLCDHPTDSHDVPYSSPLPASENQEAPNDSSAVCKTNPTTLSFSLG